LKHTNILESTLKHESQAEFVDAINRPHLREDREELLLVIFIYISQHHNNQRRFGPTGKFKISKPHFDFDLINALN
jgi:hypothetical protein